MGRKMGVDVRSEVDPLVIQAGGRISGEACETLAAYGRNLPRLWSAVEHLAFEVLRV